MEGRLYLLAAAVDPQEAWIPVIWVADLWELAAVWREMGAGLQGRVAAVVQSAAETVQVLENALAWKQAAPSVAEEHERALAAAAEQR